MKRPPNWLLAAFALLLFACAGSKRTPEVPAPPKPPLDPWSWLPEQASLIGQAELGPLRKTTLWSLWSRIDLARAPGWVDLTKVDRAIFAGLGENRDNAAFVVALQGKFAPDELAALALRDQVTPEPQGLITIYRRPDAVWTQLSPSLIVAASPEQLAWLVSRASAGPGTAIKERPLYQSLAKQVGLESAHLAVVAEDPEGKRRALLERQAARYGLSELTREALRLGISVDVGADYRLLAVAEAADPARAAALAQSVRDALGSLADNFVLRLLGVSSLVSQLRTDSTDSYVYVRATLPEQQISELLKRLDEALRFATGDAAPAVQAP